MNERRTRGLLILLLLAQLVFLTASVPAESRNSHLESFGLRAIAKLSRAVTEVGTVSQSMADAVRLQTTVQRENRSLRRQIRDLQQKNARLQGLDLEAERLAEALAHLRMMPEPLRLAQVVYVDYSSWQRTLLIYLGGAEVAPNDAVTVDRGLVGRIVATAGGYAKVQLVTDRASSVGSMIARTRRQGVTRGAGDGSLSLDYVPLQADVREGDRVVTAGIDGVFPRGLTIGTVVSVEPGSELFHRILVAPAVDFGLLDQVFVIPRQSLPEALKRATADARP